MIKRLLPLLFLAASAFGQTPGNNVLCGGVPCVNVDPAGAATAITSGKTYNGPQAVIPAVTPTLNTNVLRYTGEMGFGWDNWSMQSMTGGQGDELGTNTATLVIPNTQGTRHRISLVSIYEPSLTAATNTVFSVYAKPSSTATYPYLFVYYVFSDGSSTTLTSVFNTSTCAVVTTPSGATLSAASAANGFCYFTIQYSFPAAAIMQQLQFACTASSGSDYQNGNGTDGCVLSHPDLRLGSTAGYQDVTTMHRYAAAAFDATGKTGGISPWVTPTSYPALAESNSITVPCVSGATSYKIYRTGGYTQGALPGTVTCGSAFTDNSLVADGTTPPTGNVVNTVSNPIPDTRPMLTQSSLVNLTTGTGGYVAAADLEPGLPGTITHIHITGALNNSGAYTSLPTTMYLHTMCNGAAFNSAQDQIITLGGLFYIDDIPTRYVGNYNAVTLMNQQYFGLNKALEIPFTSGCKMMLGSVVTNGVLGAFWIEVNYKVGQYYSSPYRKSWHVQENPLATFSAYAQIPMLTVASSAGGGEIENVEQLVSSPTNYQYLEGNLTGIADGTQALVCNGSEDCFGGSEYFNNGANSDQTDHWGDWIGSGLTNKIAAYDVLLYRQFGHQNLGDSLIFQNSIDLHNFVGQQGENAPPATVQAKTAVTYWLGQ